VDELDTDGLPRVRARITGQVRSGVAVETISEVPALELGDSFRIGEDRVQIVSLSQNFTSEPAKPESIDVEWVVAPLPA
jgi:hypothetical protein